jgi:hypothetical protein
MADFVPVSIPREAADVLRWRKKQTGVSIGEQFRRLIMNVVPGDGKNE